MLERITALINGVIVEEDPSAKLSPEDVVQLIGEGFITDKYALSCTHTVADYASVLWWHLQTLVLPLEAPAAVTGCWTLLMAHGALWACANTACAWACCRMARCSWACLEAPTCRR